MDRRNGSRNTSPVKDLSAMVVAAMASKEKRQETSSNYEPKGFSLDADTPRVDHPLGDDPKSETPKLDPQERGSPKGEVDMPDRDTPEHALPGARGDRS